jgi:cytochrome b6-f complex iron-sulfur subunit
VTSNPQATATRRSFIDWLLSIGVLGWAASVAYPVLRYVLPSGTAGVGGPVVLTAEEADKVRRDRFTICQAGTLRLIVFDDGSGKYRALAAKCTHEGCTVQYVPGDAVIWCACHNGRFDLEGRNISGPPPRPLSRYGVHVDEAGRVIVTPEPIAT